MALARRVRSTNQVDHLSGPAWPVTLASQQPGVHPVEVLLPRLRNRNPPARYADYVMDGQGAGSSAGAGAGAGRGAPNSTPRPPFPPGHSPRGGSASRGALGGYHTPDGSENGRRVDSARFFALEATVNRLADSLRDLPQLSANVDALLRVQQPPAAPPPQQLGNPPPALPAQQPPPAAPPRPVKLPTLWKEMPEPWFHHVEGIFRAAHVFQQQPRYDALLTALTDEHATLLGALLRMDQASPTIYDDAKALILRKTTLTPIEKARKLVSLPALGDDKPSELLERLMALQDERFWIDPLFLMMWIDRLPENIGNIVVNRPMTTVAELRAAAAEADLLASNNRQRTVSFVPPPPVAVVDHPDVDAIHHRRPPPRRRGRSVQPARNHQRRPSGPGSSFQVNNNDPHCRFHQQWGDRARNCAPTCPKYATFQSPSGNATQGRR